MFIGTEGNYRLNTYKQSNGRPGTRTYKRLMGGLAEFEGIRRGQVWEVERSKSKPWQRYTVTSISHRPLQSKRYNLYMVYMHHVKSGRLIVKDVRSLIKRANCRLVSEAPASADQT